MKPIKLYNTLTRKKDDFSPIDGKTVRMYSCGLTVYNIAHIGNLRAYIFVDTLVKTLKFLDYDVFDVMNTTDVGHLVSDADDGEDKIEKSARQNNTTPQAIAQKYTEIFLQDCEKLNIAPPRNLAPATNYVDKMIDMVSTLEKKGLTYITSDGVYFDSSKFEKYNELSRQPLENNKAGARIDIGEKRNAHDFAVWKFVDKNSLQKWSSPWNENGCPGWHIECSAIARHFLGDTFDIHTGGIDHIPIHHTNEIAQTESITGKPMSRFWMHNEFITVDNKKMSKSLGNVYTVQDIIDRGYNPIAYRYYCLLSHYRSMLNFTWEGLASAQTAYENLVQALSKHKNPIGISPVPLIGELSCAFTDAMSDDLNTPKAIAHIWEIVKFPPNRAIYEKVLNFDRVLSLGLEKAVDEYLLKQSTSIDLPSNITDLANARQTAKQNKDFKTADELRAEIEKSGYSIKDTKDGYVISKAD